MRNCASEVRNFDAPGMTIPVPPVSAERGLAARNVLCSGPRGVFRRRRPGFGECAMSLGTILIIILIIFLLGGFSGRFGGYGYGMGHSGMGIGGVILVVLLVLLLLGKL